MALCALALLTLGVVMVTSAGMAVRPIDAAGGVHSDTRSAQEMFFAILTSRSSIYMGLALLGLFVVSRLPLRVFAEHFEQATERKALTWFGVGVLALLGLLALVYVPGLSRSVNGSRRWIELPIGAGTSVQPSELVKWGMVGLVAWFAAARSEHLRGGVWSLRGGLERGLWPALLGVGIVGAAVVVEDLGTGVLIGAVACLVLIAGGARIWHFLLLSPIPLVGIAAAIWQSPYRMQRLIAFLDPYNDLDGAGYQVIQSLGAIAGGEGFGRGLGHGLQKLGYLPEDRTDFLFAVICEELGVAGAVLVVALYLGLMWAGLSIVRRESLMTLKLAGLGVLLTIGLQAIMNLFVVTGMGPTKGIALPLLSSGGTGWVLTAGAIGLLVGMDRFAARTANEGVSGANFGEADSEEPGGVSVDDSDGADSDWLDSEDGVDELDEWDEEDELEDAPEIVIPTLPVRPLHTR